MCTGIWHGASFNFLFWGIYHGFFLMLEEYIPFIGKKGGKLKSFFQHVYALLVVCVGFVFFRADTMKQGCFWIREMFTDFGWKASAMSLTLAAADTGISCNAGSGTGRSSSGKQHAEKV